MKKRCLSFLLVCAAAHAASLSFSGLLDPAPDGFCTDAAHPLCLKLTNIQFTGLAILPAVVDIEDRNGNATIYVFQNVVVNVDPGGLTYSGSVTPDEAFSITLAQETDFQQGFLYLGVVGAGDVDIIGTNFSPADATATTPEPGSAGLLLLGLAAGGFLKKSRFLSSHQR